jgi:hypothetical protein
MNIVGKVLGVSMDVEKAKQDGSTYVVHLLTLKTEKGFKEISIFGNSPVAKKSDSLLRSLTDKDTVTVKMEQKGKFMNATEITKGAVEEVKSDDKKFVKSGYDTAGAIKGNAVTNGVHLAIARHGKDATKDHIEAAALEVLSVHKKLEGISLDDLRLTPKAKSTVRTEAVDVDDVSIGNNPF